MSINSNLDQLRKEGGMKGDKASENWGLFTAAHF